MAAEIEHTRKGDVVEIPLEEFERLEATLEFLSDEALQRGILKSLDQYRQGRSRPWGEVREEL